jgi:hypothetical protein
MTKLNIPDVVSETTSYLNNNKISLFNGQLSYSFKDILTDMISVTGKYILTLTPETIKNQW